MNYFVFLCHCVGAIGVGVGAIGVGVGVVPPLFRVLFE